MLKLFDTTRLTLRSATKRPSRVVLADAKEGLAGVTPFSSEAFRTTVQWLKVRKGPTVWFLGGHVFKASVGWYLYQLRAWMHHVATNGAGLVHAWEMVRLGHTSEDVPTSIKDGTFGMWQETSEINAVVSRRLESGIGEQFSIIPRVPTTVHVACGQDVFCMHPNYDPEAWGVASYVDFLKFASVVEGMQGGTLLVFGSAVCAPEVFLKALGMARNASGGKPDDIAVAIFDCVAPPRSLENRYYHRPWKTLMERVASKSVFVQGRHEVTIPALWKELCT